jgi:tRNA threonylcarbamoyladenosine biosynthesis protein TsaB
VFIEASLKEVGIAYKDLVAIAVSHGPGSYTGLRIGVSAAKGLCYALDSFDSSRYFKILAAQAPVSDGLITMIDARRMEVYSAIFTSELESKRETRAEIIDSFGELTGPVYFVGDCSEKAQTVLIKENFTF